MNQNSAPIFTGPNAELAAYQWTQNTLASQMLSSVNEFSQRLVNRINDAKDPLDILDATFAAKQDDSKYGGLLNEKDRLYYYLLDVPGIGAKTAHHIIRKYRTFPEILDSSVADLMKLPTIGPKRAELIKKKISELFY
jgi:ERCC4-type nuclease